MLQLLLGAGALRDLRDSSGSTPLHLALEAQVGGGWEGSRGAGAWGSAALLLCEGTVLPAGFLCRRWNPPSITFLPDPPSQDERAVRLLLQAGANPTLSNNDMGEDSTPLHAAAAAGRPGILQALLDAWPAGQLSAAVNQPGENGWTPLMLAARRGSADCVRLLLEQGADVAAKNAQGRTAADIAAVNKRQAVTLVLGDAGTGIADN